MPNMVNEGLEMGRVIFWCVLRLWATILTIFFKERQCRWLEFRERIELQVKLHDLL